MTTEQCENCRFAGLIWYPDGDMFCCDKDNDPRMPFNMEADTFCPCFEPLDDFEIQDTVEVD